VLKARALGQMDHVKKFFHLAVQPGHLGNENGFDLIGLNGSYEGLVSRTWFS
jgi:hypothetical protein